MTTSIMKMRDNNKGDNYKNDARDFGDGKNCDDRVCSGIVVGDSYTQSATNRFF